jgi:hypothetical protein
MLKIDNSLLEEVGLASLPDSEKNSFLKHIYETLEMRVGIRLADQMSNEQLDEFERYFEAKDDAGAFKWLETNFPNYKDIVQEEFDKLKSEVALSAPQILSASQSPAAQPQAPEAMLPQQPQPPAMTPPPVQAAAPAPQFYAAPASYTEPVQQQQQAFQAPEPQLQQPPAMTPPAVQAAAPAPQFYQQAPLLDKTQATTSPPSEPPLPYVQPSAQPPSPSSSVTAPQTTSPPAQTYQSSQPQYPSQQPPAGPSSSN